MSVTIALRKILENPTVQKIIAVVANEIVEWHQTSPKSMEIQ